MKAVLAAALLLSGLRAEVVEGWVSGAGVPLAGVRVHADRLRRVVPVTIPEARTGADGRFRIELDAGDDLLVVEKDGWVRDLVPRSEWGQPIRLQPQPAFRREPVLVVRVDVPGVPARLDDAELRTFLFGRDPGRASAANYLYEVSKGRLLLEEGRILHVRLKSASTLPVESQKPAIAREALRSLRDMDLRDLDRVDNRTGAPKPDGKPDHLWVFVPGPPGSVTAADGHIRAGCLMVRPDATRGARWPLVFLTEETPLGNLVHETLHAMGEHRVDDLYRGCEDPATAGIWDLMDAGQYRGWDSHHPAAGPWREDTGYSPSHPGPWVRTELWYRGGLRDAVRTQKVEGRGWTGWIAPIARAPGADPQRIVVADVHHRGRFWEFWISRPWGFERGRVGGRFGPGHEGLLVARVDPSGRDRKGGPVRVLDAHPGTPEPPQPRFPCGRFELDDAAFHLGPGETARGEDGSLAWEVLERDDAGRLKVSIHRNPSRRGR